MELLSVFYPLFKKIFDLPTLFAVWGRDKTQGIHKMISVGHGKSGANADYTEQKLPFNMVRAVGSPKAWQDGKNEWNLRLGDGAT